MSKPALPVILGRGSLADAMRAEIARDPDRYRAVTIGVVPVGVCPCCDQEVYSVTSRVTGWVPGYATGASETAVAHPVVEGGAVGCCCVAPNWGPKHASQREGVPDAV